MKAVGSLVAFVAITGCTNVDIFSCDISTLSELASPSGRYVATVEKRACGATTADSIVVTIRERRPFFLRDRTDLVFSSIHTEGLAMVWTGPTDLSIARTTGDVKVAKAASNGVTISYSVQNPGTAK
jgi:hypothetical protein